VDETLSISEGPTASTLAYLRHARRLRARWAGRLGRMHVELRQLNQDFSPEIMPERERTQEEIFCDDVAAAMEGTVLRYSERSRLLKEARRVGIERFEANLLIAKVQHGVAGKWEGIRRAERRRAIWPVVVFLVVQGVIAGVLMGLWL